jgi:exonuclease III
MLNNYKNISNIVIINWNANGIKRNCNTFAAFLSQHNVDIACISETHLCTTDSIKFNGYSIYRNDRSAVRPAGGVAILSRTKIKHQQAYIPRLRSLEAVAITLLINTTIVSAYQSPSYNMYTYDLNIILNNYNKIIIIGDLNSKHVNWKCNTTNANGRKLYKYLSNSAAIISAPDNPTHYLYDPNKSPDILDVVLLKSTSLIINQELLFELDSDHLPVKI